MNPDRATLFLSGDVMLGRGLDQILPHPGDPQLREEYMTDARGYVELAEQVNGPIPRPVDPSWPWGVARSVLDDAAPDARVINLETSVTHSAEFAVGKRIHYRMSPGNLACLTSARTDVCVLANNHVLDLGVPGLEETLGTLAGAGLRTAGAGHDVEAARQPAAVALETGGRVLVFAWGMASSGIPEAWAATEQRPGIAFLDGPSDVAAEEVLDAVRRHRRPGDIAVVSVHWGSNWGYAVSRSQQDLAHALVDGGVDVVHGHSSHHPRPIEVYRDRLILYGCGDLINDYEGIGGHERYRPDLRLLYLPSHSPHTGELLGLRVVPLQTRRMRLEHSADADVDWLREELVRVSTPFGIGVERGHDGALLITW